MPNGAHRDRSLRTLMLMTLGLTILAAGCGNTGPDRALRTAIRTDTGFDDARGRSDVQATVSDLLQQGDFASFRSQLTFAPVEATVHVTAYFTPEVTGARQCGGPYQFPLYGRPDGAAARATRQEIEDEGLCEGREIAWLADELDAYLIQVNGSARVRLPDGEAICLAHAGTNELDYTSLGRLLINAGVVPAEVMSMQAIRDAFRRDPATVRALMRKNDRYVFFREVAPSEWPEGGLGVRLTPGVSVAADPAHHPPGSVLLLSTTESATGRPIHRFVVVQDVGGAIKGPGRIDLYTGIGDEAGAVAGPQSAPGRLWRVQLRDAAAGIMD